MTTAHSFSDLLPDLLTEAQAAQVLAVSQVLLTKWRHLKRGPPYLKMEGTIRYSKAALIDWLRAQEVQP